MDVQEKVERRDEIAEIWRQYQWLYAVAGFLLGVLVAPLMIYVNTDLGDFLESLVPEALGITFTVLFINALDRRREEARRRRELRERLKREAGSPVNATAVNAVRELREHRWLEGEKGVLQGIDLSDADLEGANLAGANLADTILEGANLTNANMTNADLQGAFLSNANLQKADLSDAKLNDAFLSDADLSDADLSGAQFNNASLTRAKLYKARIVSGHFHGADLTEAIIMEASLIMCDLTKTELAMAQMQGTDFFMSDFTDATLIAANLENADLSEATLTRADLTKTIFNHRTALPDGTMWSPRMDLSRYQAVRHEDAWSPADIGLSDLNNTVFDDMLVDIAPDADASGFVDPELDIDDTQEIKMVDLPQKLEELNQIDEIETEEWVPEAFDDYFDDDTQLSPGQFDEQTTLNEYDAQLFEGYFEDDPDSGDDDDPEPDPA